MFCLKIGEFIGGPIGTILAGAALVSLATPYARRMAKPLAKTAVRGAYMVSDGVRNLSSGMIHDWQDMMSEVRTEVEQERDQSMIKQAWRNSEFEEDPETEESY